MVEPLLYKRFGVHVVSETLSVQPSAERVRWRRYESLLARCVQNDAALCTMRTDAASAQAAANITGMAWPVCQGMQLPEHLGAKCAAAVSRPFLSGVALYYV